MITKEQYQPPLSNLLFNRSSAAAVYCEGPADSDSVGKGGEEGWRK